MAVRFLVTLIEETAVIKLESNPGPALISGADSIVDEIMFLGPRSYDSVGHMLSLDYIRPLDLYLFLVDIFEQENIEILEGAEDVKADDKELGIIEKTGVS